ncbi:MAG: calcineurin-like phosphoesterase family protein [Arenimonas sp.]|nr:calcineurin-like phosphoesterase family protein [Arenimonas sp.]MBP7917502.1 calcineurin-like phosphoesterase family protein [Arenimonas sp.]
MRLCLLALLFSAPLAALPCSPSVFLDGNRNGQRDGREHGLPDVRVSDGERMVITDRNGIYSLTAEPGKTLFVIKPAGYSLPRRADGLPDSFANQPGTLQDLKYGGVTKADPSCRHFALWPEENPAKTEMTVLVFGDPQPKSMLDVDHYRRDIVQPLAGRHNAVLGISLGDIVHDDLSLHAEVKKVDKTLDAPWLYVAGNHDIDFDASDDAGSLESFRAQFGPDTFAWEERAANFLVLDDVIFLPGEKPAYIGGLREGQFRFLQSYLETADKTKLLVISAHIPFFQASPVRDTFRPEDRKRLFDLLKPFRDVLLLTAHSHTQSHVRHGPATDWHGAGRLHEYNAGAACGGYWSGIKDAEGIPDAAMEDGTPNGYASLAIKGDDYRLNWFNARQQPNQAMALHAPRVLRQGAYPGFAVFANVFMARHDTVVEVRIDDGDWLPMVRVQQADPRVLAINMLDDSSAQLRAYDRMPEATDSKHLWRFALPTDLAEGIHAISVRARDEWLGTVQQSTQYELRRAEP